MIFLFGFIKLPFAILTMLCIGFSGFGFLRDITKIKDDILPVSILAVILSFFVCLLIGVLCGWGGFVIQASDWIKSNAVLKDLINHSWPVYYVNGEETSALSYYIAAYLLPAFMGKIFHSFEAAEIINLFYFAIGLHLIILNALFFLKISDGKKIIIFLIGMIFFCGALLLAQKVTLWFYPQMSRVHLIHWIIIDDLKLQYRSIFVNLRWIPMQFIFPCLIGSVFLNYQEYVKYYVWLLLPAFLYGAFSFVALCFIAIGVCANHLVQKKINIKHMFSISNIGMTLCLGSIFILYFWGNVSSEKPESIYFHFNNYDHGRLLGAYFIFIFFMFGIHAFICWKRHKRDIVYNTTVMVLMLIPFGCMGTWNDWVMNCSIVPMFFLMLFVWEFIFNEKSHFKKSILIALLCVGAVYPAEEMVNVIEAASLQYQSEGYLDGHTDSWETMETYANRFSENISPTLVYQYFTYDLDKDIFYQYIAKRKLEGKE